MESKFYSTTIPSLNSANPATNLPKQMSDHWITQNNSERLVNALDGNWALADQIIQQGYTRPLAKVAPDGSVTYQYVSDSGYLSQGNGPLGIFYP